MPDIPVSRGPGPGDRVASAIATDHHWATAVNKRIGISLSPRNCPASRLGIRIPNVYGLKLHGSAQQVNH
jgi:hypothetical protein